MLTERQKIILEAKAQVIQSLNDRKGSVERKNQSISEIIRGIAQAPILVDSQEPVSQSTDSDPKG